MSQIFLTAESSLFRERRRRGRIFWRAFKLSQSVSKIGQFGTWVKLRVSLWSRKRQGRWTYHQRQPETEICISQRNCISHRNIFSETGNCISHWESIFWGSVRWKPLWLFLCHGYSRNCWCCGDAVSPTCESFQCHLDQWRGIYVYCQS